jgi:hypothetical protein
MGFDFELRSGESVRERVVRCCHEALDVGPMGHRTRHDDYRDFIAANQELTPAGAEALTGVATSCALFVRAVHLWCGGEAARGHYVPGTPMFHSMGVAPGFADPAFVLLGSGAPEPGDFFYIGNTAVDGHTGIVLRVDGDRWETAEGGGPPDGTLCRLRERTLAGSTFADDARRLHGWFDVTQIGLPASPASPSRFPFGAVVAVLLLGLGGGLAYAAGRAQPGWAAALTLTVDERRILDALRDAERRLGVPGLATVDRARRVTAQAPRILAETPVPLRGAPVDVVVWAIRASGSDPQLRALLEQLA